MSPRILALFLIAASLASSGDDAAEVRRIATLPVKERPRALQHLLRQSAPLISSARDDLFLHSAELRPALRELLSKKDIHAAAAQILTLIGDREDVLGLLRAEGPTALAERNGLYPVLAALVLPQREDEWSVLWRAACNEFKSAWAERVAIKTRRLTASPRARRVLASAVQEIAPQPRKSNAPSPQSTPIRAR